MCSASNSDQPSLGVLASFMPHGLLCLMKPMGPFSERLEIYNILNICMIIKETNDIEMKVSKYF